MILVIADQSWSIVLNDGDKWYPANNIDTIWAFNLEVPANLFH